MSKSELLKVYDLNGEYLHTQERQKFYDEIIKEFQETGNITKQVEVVRFLLMTTEGRIYVQKRSHTKSENPGLYDKTVGGHVKANYSGNVAAILECQEELAIPMVILPDDEFKLIHKDIDVRITGVMQQIERVNGLISIRRLRGGAEIKQPIIVNFYIGYYDGSIRFKDGESTGVETFNLVELCELIEKNPAQFTDDLRWMIDRFKKYLVPLDQYPFKS